MLARALEAARGVRVKCETKGKAIQLRQRIYKFRQTERNDSTKMYAQDDPRYGRSDYDGLAVTLREDGEAWYVFLEKFPNHDQINAIVEEI